VLGVIQRIAAKESAIAFARFRGNPRVFAFKIVPTQFGASRSRRVKFDSLERRFARIAAKTRGSIDMN
jgi:hypothetical protein